MPRDTAGNYTLPAGNPVASGEIISASWANSTMNDLGQSLSASLDRYGRGGMLAPFQFTDGTESAPGATWSNEPTTGLYRAAYGDLRFTLTGTDVQRWTSANSYLWRNSQWEEILTQTGGGGDTTINNLVVTGSFTSPGIDDNATSTTLTLDPSGNADFGGGVSATGLELLGDTPTIDSELDKVITVRGGGLSVIGAFTSRGIDDNATSTAITIDASQNVGIGETNPSSELEVNGDVTANKFIAAGSNSDQWTSSVKEEVPADYWAAPKSAYMLGPSLGMLATQGSFQTTLTSNGYRNSSGTWTSLGANSETGAAQVVLDPSGYIEFRTSANQVDGGTYVIPPAMTVSAAGNVGIGTAAGSDPSRNLEVSTTTGDAGARVTNNSGFFEIQKNAGDGYINLDDVGFMSFRNGVNGDQERLRINAAGDVLVGPSTVGQASLELKVNGSSYAEIEAINFGLNFSMPLVMQRQGGNVGIGTSDPSRKAEIMDGSAGAITPVLRLYNPNINTNSGAAIEFAAKNGNGIEHEFADIGTGVSGGTAGAERGYLRFRTMQSGTMTEAMRIDDSGNLLIGKITSGTFSTSGAEFTASGQARITSGSVPLYLNRTGVGTSGISTVVFQLETVDAGSISCSVGSAPTFLSSSDERLKDNITDHESELANVMALRPTRWDWKDEAKGTGEGFIAQELEQTAWSDLVSEGDDGFKQVAGLGTVETRLIKAIQEQQAMIETLQAEVAALKA